MCRLRWQGQILCAIALFVSVEDRSLWPCWASSNSTGCMLVIWALVNRRNSITVVLDGDPPFGDEDGHGGSRVCASWEGTRANHGWLQRGYRVEDVCPGEGKSARLYGIFVKGCRAWPCVGVRTLCISGFPCRCKSIQIAIPRGYWVPLVHCVTS